MWKSVGRILDLCPFTLTGPFARLISEPFKPGYVIMTCGVIIGVASMVGSVVTTPLQLAFSYVLLAGKLATLQLYRIPVIKGNGTKATIWLLMPRVSVHFVSHEITCTNHWARCLFGLMIGWDTQWDEIRLALASPTLGSSPCPKQYDWFLFIWSSVECKVLMKTLHIILCLHSNVWN